MSGSVEKEAHDDVDERTGEKGEANPNVRLLSIEFQSLATGTTRKLNDLLCPLLWESSH